MTAEILVTAFSVAIAVYALTSPERRLDIRIRLHTIDWAVIAAGLCAVHYLFFLPFFRNVGLVPDLDFGDWGLTRESLVYLVLLLTASYALARIATGRLRRRRIQSFQRLTERLLHSRRYPELVYVLERHLPQLVRIQENRYLAPRLREHLAPPPWRLIPASVSGQTRDRRWLRLSRTTVKLLPRYENTEVAGTVTMQQVLLSDHFVAHLAQSHPYFGLDIVKSGLPQVHDFQKKWLEALLDNQDSVLYFEIEHNQNLAGAASRYEYPTTNRLLHYYFADVRISERLAVWKPLGDYAKDLLDCRFREGAAHDRLNQPLDDFYESGQRSSPECAVLSLFDYMVSEALFQNLSYHMWLYYLPVMAKRIERNLCPAAEVDMRQEWPTPYHYLLYAMVSLLCRWIVDMTAVPADQENVVLQSSSFDHENENIPKSSILALSQVIGTIMASDKVGSRFQVYVLEIMLRLVEDLREGEVVEDYARLVIEAIARGQIGSPSPTYRDTLRGLLPHCDDLILQHTVGDEVLRRSSELLGETDAS